MPALGCENARRIGTGRGQLQGDASITRPVFRALAISAAASLALAACEDREATYEAAPTDESGELIVATPDPNAVPVDVPQAEMTMVPGSGDMAPPATAMPPAAATATPVGEPMMKQQ